MMRPWWNKGHVHNTVVSGYGKMVKAKSHGKTKLSCDSLTPIPKYNNTTIIQILAATTSGKRTMDKIE